jgi:pimeloyl-ACP methyl ester carboxylesterase
MFCLKRVFMIAAAVVIIGSSAAIAAPKISDKMVKNGDAQIEYLVQGHGPIIVLLPSLGRGAGDFDVIASELAAAGFRVIRPQPRGIGKSTGPMKGITLHDLASDVSDVIGAENHGKKVIVAGHAFGGFISRMVATDRPDLVRADILIAAGAGKKPSPPKARQAIKDSANASLPEAERLAALQYVFFAPGNDPHIWLTGWYPDVLAAQRLAGDATPSNVYFRGGTAPILDIQPEEDRIVPVSDSDILKTELAPRVTVVLIPNAGHALIVEQPKEVSETIISYAKTLPH